MAADKKARDEAKAAKKAEARRYREEQERLAQGSTLPYRPQVIFSETFFDWYVYRDLERGYLRA